MESLEFIYEYEMKSAGYRNLTPLAFLELDGVKRKINLNNRAYILYSMLGYVL